MKSSAVCALVIQHLFMSLSCHLRGLVLPFLYTKKRHTILFFKIDSYCLRVKSIPFNRPLGLTLFSLFLKLTFDVAGQSRTSSVNTEESVLPPYTV